MAGPLQEALAATEEGVRVLERPLAERRDVPVIHGLAVAKFPLGAIYEALYRSAAACTVWRLAGQRLPQIESAPLLCDTPYVRAELPAQVAACAQAGR